METIRNVRIAELLLLMAKLNALGFQWINLVPVEDQTLEIRPVNSMTLSDDEDQQETKLDNKINPDMGIEDLLGE